MLCGRHLSALMAARPLVRNRADEPQHAGSAPNAQPLGHECPDFRALCDRSQQSVEHLPARVTHDREAWSAVASELALQRSLHDDRPAGQRARVSYRLPPGGFPGALPLAWLAKGEVGAASFSFSFFGFLASRLPRCSPLAMACLRSGWDGFSVGRRHVEQMIEVGHHAVDQLAPAWIGRRCALGEEA